MFNITCPHRKCQQLMQPYLDPSNDKVYCSSCDEQLTQITPFIKNQLKQNKKFRPKKQIPFATTCKSCSKEDQPVIIKDQVSCPHCKSPHSHLSETFKLMLKTQLKTVKNDI